MKLSMADTRRRVKLYTLNNTRQWDDRGTGHVLAAYCERQEGMTLMVRAESDGQLLLESKIQSDTAYQKQQETLIVWSETESSDLALSFQEKAGCDEIWEKICEVQGKDPSVDITQDMPDDGDDDEDDLTTGRLDDTMDGLQHQSTSPYSLPQCELGELDDIAECFSFSMRTPVGREQLARSLEDNNYVPKLLELFRQCEDLEDTDSLHKLFEIVKFIFLLNKSGVFEVLIQEENIMNVVGCLEYDPALSQPRRHRQYLMSGVSFKEVLPISNVELRKKIHQTFRLQYIQDVVLPTPSVFEENMLSTLASVIFFNKVEIVSMVQEDTGLLPNLFRQLGDENLTDSRRRELAGFLRELCCLSQTLQPSPKDDFFKYLNQLGLLPGIEQLFACEDQQAHRLAIDIFQHVVEHSPSMVRDFANQEMQRDNNANGDEDLFLLNMVIEQMICDPDPELSGAMQLNGLLRILLDPENMLAKNNEKTEFLGFFYRHCMHVLMAPVLANTADETGPSKDDYQTAHILSLILDLVTFSVEHHTYHVKNYILNKDLLRRVLVLLKSRHKFLGLSALRFMRRIVGKLDEFYNRYIIKGDLFKPVVVQLSQSGKRYNLINSAILEMFEFINTEKVKSLTAHIVQQHFTMLESVDYVQTFVKLKTTYEQQQDRLSSSRSSSLTTDDANSSMSHNHRFGRDSTMDEEEEMWFDRDGDDDEDEPNTLLDLDTTGPQSSSDANFNVSPKANIDSVFEAADSPQNSPPSSVSSTTTTTTPSPCTNFDKPPHNNGVLQENTRKLQEKGKIAINIPSLVKGVNGLTNNNTSDDDEEKDKQPSVKNGLIGGLVDYSDDDSDDDDASDVTTNDVTTAATTTTSNIDDIKDKITSAVVTAASSGSDSTTTTPTIIPPQKSSAEPTTTTTSLSKDDVKEEDSTSTTTPNDDSSPPVSKKPRLSIEATAANTTVASKK